LNLGGRRIILSGVNSVPFRVLLARAIVIMTALVAPAARADPAPPCTHCTLDVPAARDGEPADPRPLLVVLHGDRESAKTAGARWRSAAMQRNWVVLSLQCPTDQGCRDSWWQWDGDPKWVMQQVMAITKTTEIDPKRVYLAGWSGGATYIGMHAPQWTPMFAAVVIHGGGHAPAASCPEHPLSAYFLVGDANPLHHLMKDLRAWFDDCHQPVKWDLLRGADHERENRALDRKKALVILDWLTNQTGTQLK
jgi:poly(3-hydroxybutyrate) depolymerase